MSSKSKLFYTTTQKEYRISQLSELCPAANSSALQDNNIKRKDRGGIWTAHYLFGAEMV